MTILQTLIYGLIISLVITSIGFKKTLWFISIGYTMTIVILGLLSLIFKHTAFHLYNYLQILFLLIWGSRLGFYLIQREYDTNYKSSVKDQTDTSEGLTLLVKAGIWLSVSLLYICMFSPAVFTWQNSLHSPLFTNIGISLGLLIMGAGIAIETIADRQKSRFKKLNPKSYCNTGLYRWVRYPNYFGEIMVWLGNFICALPFFHGWWQSVIAVSGLISIVLIMMGSAKRLEKKQSLNYGKNPEFQEYEKTVPILFPWLRLYTLQNVRVYLE